MWIFINQQITCVLVLQPTKALFRKRSVLYKRSDSLETQLASNLKFLYVSVFQVISINTSNKIQTFLTGSYFATPLIAQMVSLCFNIRIRKFNRYDHKQYI